MSVTTAASTIKFDWSAALAMLFQLQRLAEDIKAWIPDLKERKTHSDEIFGLATFVASAVNNENDRHAASPGRAIEPPTDESPWFWWRLWRFDFRPGPCGPGGSVEALLSCF